MRQAEEELDADVWAVILDSARIWQLENHATFGEKCAFLIGAKRAFKRRDKNLETLNSDEVILAALSELNMMRSEEVDELTYRGTKDLTYSEEQAFIEGFIEFTEIDADEEDE